MSTTVGRLGVVLLAAFLAFGALPGLAAAQESKTGALVKELTQVMDQGKLDAIAAKDTAGQDIFVAALYFPGSQLLVVSARYAVPQLMIEKIAKKDYREIYTDLNAASIEGSKFLVMDMGADGLKPDKSDNHFDTCDIGARSVVFDGEWKKQKMPSSDEYNKTFADAEARYAKMLTVLIAQAKKQ